MSAEHDLKRRIEKLERENRRMKLCMVPVTAMLGVLLLTGLAAPNEGGPLRSIEAETFTVVGKDGKSLVRIGPDRAGGGRVEVLDADGRTAALIRAEDGLGEIALWDTARKSPKPQVSIGCVPQKSGGGTQIFMHGSSGQPAINLIAQQRGNVRTW